LALVCGLPLLAFALTGAPLTFSPPQMDRFNVRGGLEILPEFAALTVALTTYTAGFIAEVVRAGVLSVSAGQAEAAHALGLRPGATLRLVIVPQAMRVIIPPLTSQYLNLIKNSSLAVAIGYPDLVQVFTGTVLNITGQAVEVVAITMAVYLTISLFASLLMNLYARTTSVVEH
jgi:general L-amino acid transport system permease protein